MSQEIMDSPPLPPIFSQINPIQTQARPLNLEGLFKNKKKQKLQLPIFKAIQRGPHNSI